MTAGSERYFYSDSSKNGKTLTVGACMIFLLALATEKVAHYIGVPNFGTLLKWLFLAFAACTLQGGVFYLIAHNRMVIAKIDEGGMTCFWGAFWSRKKVVIPWNRMMGAYTSMVHKKRMAFPIYWGYTDVGGDEEVLKIVLGQPVEALLADQIRAINKRLLEDATVETNKEGTELYLREKPVGGYEPLLEEIRKYVP